MSRRDVRTWEAESVKDWDRENAVGGEVSGVEAVDEGDDRGLEVADETIWLSLTLGTQTCLPPGSRMNWPRSWERCFVRESEKWRVSGSVAKDKIESLVGDAGLEVTRDDVVGVSSGMLLRLSCNLHCASKFRKRYMQISRLIKSNISERSLIRRSSSNRNVCGTISEDLDGRIRWTSALMKSHVFP